MQNKLKHLDYIQNIIGRMANNSFLLKGWTITLLSVLFALSRGKIDYYIAFISIFLIVMFWALDAYFLAKENVFRERFNEVRIKDESGIDFSMKLEGKLKNTMRWYVNVLSETLLTFYGSIMFAVFMFTCFI